MQNNSPRLNRMIDCLKIPIDIVSIDEKNINLKYTDDMQRIAEEILRIISKELDVLERQFKTLLGIDI